jgi:FkbM family methyltransferase
MHDSTGWERGVEMAPLTGLFANSSRRLVLVPSFVAKVENWPSIFAARLGWGKLPEIRFRDGVVWSLFDLRPGLVVFRDVYLNRVYDAPFRIDPTGTVVDLGANIGLFTLLASKTLVPRGQVIAVEPHPELAVILRSNLFRNRLSNVHLVEAAAYTEDGDAELHLASTSMGATICPRDYQLGTVVVRTIELGRIVAQAERIDLLKADIEGAEWPILFGSHPDLWKRISRLVIEFHLDSSNGRTVADLVTQLAYLGYGNVRIQELSDLLGYVWAERLTDS